MSGLLISVAHNLRRASLAPIVVGIIPFATLLGDKGKWAYVGLWAASLACFVAGMVILGVADFIEWRRERAALQADSASRWTRVMGR